MKSGRVLAVLVAGLFGSYLSAEEKAPLVRAMYPGLGSGGLTYARLSDLPKGTLLKAGELVLAEEDVADEIAKAPHDVQAQLKKNGFFVLEQIAGPKLIVQIAKADAACGRRSRPKPEGYWDRL